MRRRLHLPSMVLGAVLGSVGLGVASGPGAGLWSALRGEVVAVQQEVIALRALSQTLPPRHATPFLASVDRIDEAAGRMAHDLRTARRMVRPAPVHAPMPAQPTGPVPVDPGNYARVRQTVASESFSQQKLERLVDALQGRHLTVDQVIGLLELFTFDRDKVTAAVAMYPHIVDPGQWYRVFDAFTFDSHKNALRDQTSRQP